MARDILVQYLYQLCCLMSLLYLGPLVFPELQYPFWIGEQRDLATGESLPRMVHYTFLLHTTVQLALANLLNCRALQTNSEHKQWNPLTKFYTNFWLCILFSFAMFTLYLPLVWAG